MPHFNEISTEDLLKKYGHRAVPKHKKKDYPGCKTIKEAFNSTDDGNLKYSLRVSMLKIHAGKLGVVA